MFDLEKYTIAQRIAIDKALDEWLPAESREPTLLSKAMRYSVFSGGKRFRPLLTLAAGEAVAGTSEAALRPAGAMELLHTYSLMHDDLPALDDDDMRRGKLTSHKVFGEAQAILAGDGLLTLAFEWLATAKPLAPYAAGDLALELAKAAGPEGMVGGQVEDVLAEGQEPSQEKLLSIHTRKTVLLVRAAMRMGAMAQGASPEQLAALTTYGEELGMAYQIQDDIDDLQTDGEQESSDVRLKKMTAVTVFGLEKSQQMVVNGLHKAMVSLDQVNLHETGKAALVGIAQWLLHV